MTRYERKENKFKRDDKPRRKLLNQKNKNGIPMWTDRPEKPKYFPGE